MSFIFLPLVGALIGWVTNYIAIRLLFRPQDPWRLSFVVFQGLIPKRRDQLAGKVGQVVAEQLFPLDALSDRLDLPAMQKEVDRLTREAVESWCEHKMGRLPVALRQFCSSYLRDIVAAEMAANFPRMARMLLRRMADQVDVRRVVTEKINSLALDEVEKLVLDVAQKELKQIERLGAVLGLVIGFLQAVVLHFLGT